MSSYAPNCTVVHTGAVDGAVAGGATGAAVVNATVNCGLAITVGGTVFGSTKLSARSPVKPKVRSLAADSPAGICADSVTCHLAPFFCNEIFPPARRGMVVRLMSPADAVTGLFWCR